MWRRLHLDAGLPLTALAGTAVLLACTLTVGASAGVLVAEGRLHGALLAVLVGGVVAVAVGAAAALAARAHAGTLRELRSRALARIDDSAEQPRPRRRRVVVSTEVEQLARTLEALQVRVRVADEVAERHRRSAETASAGMFELLSGLVAAEEGARGQLAAELHDTVAQTLMLARMRLHPEVASEERALAAELVAEAEEQVRAVMARTRPPALRDGDLARAVGALRDDLARRYGLVVRLDWPQRPHPLPLVTAVTVYRFFQEALLNVVKHADTDAATASLQLTADGLRASVHDDGPGFDPAEVHGEGGRHVGLGLLRERARLAGGALEVRSWPEPGTTLILTLPAGAGGFSASTLPWAVAN
ncbi:MAG: sensor histidine kinase [Mycobacteriales bacterium]